MAATGCVLSPESPQYRRHWLWWPKGLGKRLSLRHGGRFQLALNVYMAQQRPKHRPSNGFSPHKLNKQANRNKQTNKTGIKSLPNKLAWLSALQITGRDEWNHTAAKERKKTTGQLTQTKPGEKKKRNKTEEKKVNIHFGVQARMWANTHACMHTHIQTHTARGTVNKSASSWGSKRTNPVEIRIKP